MNRRIGGLGGLVFIVLTVATLFLAPGPPDPPAPASEVAAWARDNAGGIELQAVFMALAGMALVAFAAGAHDMLSPAGRNDGLAGAAWTGLALLIVGWVLAASIGALVALYEDRLSDDSILLGLVAYGAAASVGTVGTTLLLAGFALSAHRQVALPNWTTIVAAIGVVLNIASLAAYTTDSTSVFALVYLGFAAFAIWIIGVSVAMLRSGAVESRVRAMSPAA